MRRLLFHAGCLSLAVIFVAAGAENAREGAATQPYASVTIADVPHVKQRPDFCGEACIAMVAGKLGKSITQDMAFNVSRLSPEEGRGCHTRELVTAAKALGFKPGEVWHTTSGAKLSTTLEEQFKALHADLVAGVPSIVCMHYDDAVDTTEHFRLVTGYDAKTDEVIYHEPAMEKGAYQRMARATFLKRWPLKAGPDSHMVIRLRMAADIVVEPAVSLGGGFSPADFAQHVRALKEELPEGFTVVVERPFVVIGDEKPEVVRQRAASTVRWATAALKTQFFKKDPADILNIYLFQDAASYRKHAKDFFNDEPSTPFGYYSHSDKALVMNISTGGGTLVHEIVHPFMAANFPKCPPWLNEGMGSLYEQSAERNGKIVGLTNWRLAGLQKTIKTGKLPAFKDLCDKDVNGFYGGDTGTHYAQARYLCYYLQEKGLLEKYYRAFVADQKNDPTGYATLQKILDEKDMEEFQKRWEKWVLTLKFPT